MLVFENVIDTVDRLVFLLVDNLRVYLRGGNVLVSEQLARGINVNVKGQHHRCETVAGEVIGHMLGYACRFRPFVEDYADTAL